MRKAIIFLITLICTSGYAQEYSNPTIEQISACGLPVLVVTTVNGEEPTCDIINAPEGENGSSITNVTKVPGRLSILKGSDTLYDSGDYEEDVAGITFRIRGNTTALWDKKPYKINLQKKADLLFRGDDSHKDKDWVLLKTYDLFNPVGFNMNKIMGMQWAPEYEVVNLFVNGEYRGIYTLVESVKRNADARLNVDKATGYVFECDPYWWNENVYFKSNNGKAFTFKYPSDKTITDEQIEYMRAYMNNVETSIANGTYGNYIDVDSWARWLLAVDMLGNKDAAGANIYMTKYDNTDDSKIIMANLWDFDGIGQIQSTEWSRVHNKYFYFQDLFNSPCEQFLETYKKIWQDDGARLKSDFLSFLTNYLSTDEAKYIDASIPYDEERWQYFDAETTQAMVDDYYSYYSRRFDWLDNNIPLITSGVKDITADTDNESVIYNLLGQKVSSTSTHGLFIINGKKVLKP